MTTGQEAPAALPLVAQRDDDAATVLRRMISLTDDIIAGTGPLDGLCTLAMLLTRHELVLHLAVCDGDCKTMTSNA